ncbi:MAG: hypothetical protein Ct9H90mP25_0410 [Gammaproteobacteria bacterium]|nr:MAG: hypothetical protein Ct9H90mP25_0410 [Gammaproteobacteria bacterium]
MQLSLEIGFFFPAANNPCTGMIDSMQITKLKFYRTQFGDLVKFQSTERFARDSFGHRYYYRSQEYLSYLLFAMRINLNLNPKKKTPEQSVWVFFIFEIFIWLQLP